MNNIITTYKEFSDRCLLILEKFSEKALEIESEIQGIFYENIYISEKIKNFQRYMSIGRYYHFKCHGYMELISYDRIYSHKTLCNWVEKFLTPAGEIFDKSFLEFELAMKEEGCEIFGQLDVLKLQVDELKKIWFELMDLVEEYELDC